MNKVHYIFIHVRLYVQTYMYKPNLFSIYPSFHHLHYKYALVCTCGNSNNNNKYKIMLKKTHKMSTGSSARAEIKRKCARVPIQMQTCYIYFCTKLYKLSHTYTHTDTATLA